MGAREVGATSSQVEGGPVMILRIELPKTNMAIEGAVVAEWHKKVGDVIEYGDELVDIAVEKVMRLQRKPAMKVLNTTRQRKARYFAVKGGGFRVRVVAQDSGRLVAIDTPEGTWVKEGSALATMSSQVESTTISDDVVAEAVARVVVNRVETTTEAFDG